jgi:hypothetical protein
MNFPEYRINQAASPESPRLKAAERRARFFEAAFLILLVLVALLLLLFENPHPGEHYPPRIEVRPRRLSDGS